MSSVSPATPSDGSNSYVGRVLSRPGASTTTPPSCIRPSVTERRQPSWQHGQLRLSYARAPLSCP